MSDALIARLLRKMAEKNQDRLLAETESLMADEYGIDVAAEMEAIKAQDVPEIVADYYLLLKVVHHSEKPKQVKLDSNCHLVLIVDGIRYDMKKGYAGRIKKAGNVCGKLISCSRMTFFQRFKVN